MQVQHTAIIFNVICNCLATMQGITLNQYDDNFNFSSVIYVNMYIFILSLVMTPNSVTIQSVAVKIYVAKNKRIDLPS